MQLHDGEIVYDANCQGGLDGVYTKVTQELREHVALVNEIGVVQSSS